MAVPNRVPKVLVTGADGFVGRWLIDELSRHLPAGGAVVTSRHRPESAVPEGASDSVAFDIRDRAAVAAAIASLRPTAVIHLAAVTTLAEAKNDVRQAWDVNFYGTMNVAEALRASVPDARFVFVSTSEVYGASFRGRTTPVDEDTPLDPASVYGASKAAAEDMLGQMAHDGLDVVRLRAFNHTGPGQSARFVVPAFASQIVAIERGRQPPVIKVGNLDVHRDFLDVRDVVTAYRLCLTSDALPPRPVLNLASGRPRKIGTVLEELLALSRVSITVEVDEARVRPVEVEFATGDASRAHSLLGWSPAVPWTRTLADVLEDQRGA